MKQADLSFIMYPNKALSFFERLDVTYVNETAVNGVGRFRELLSVL